MISENGNGCKLKSYETDGHYWDMSIWKVGKFLSIFIITSGAAEFVFKALASSASYSFT